jgi:taurine dioxygenase
MTSFLATPLHDYFGLEIHDLDLSQPVDPQVTDRIAALVSEHGVLLFRRQLLTEADLIRFARAFGELETTIYTKGVSPYNPEVIYISNLKYPDGDNVGLLGDQELDWHSDQTYRARPATGSILYGLEVPSTSGSTYWANQYLAYESLPDQVKLAIEGKIGIFSYAKRLEVFYPKDQKDDRELTSRAPEVAPHPIVLSHPVTGRKALYADPVTLLRIEGLTPKENEHVLGALTEHACNSQFVYRHEWRQGDVLFWDNGCTLHRRDPIQGDHPRFMKRMTIYLRPDRHCVPH